MPNEFSYMHFEHPRNKYKLTKGYMTQLAFTFEYPVFKKFFSTSKKGLLVFIPSYAWNGASGPVRDVPYNMEASCVHDALCQLLEDGDLSFDFKPQVDEEYRRRLAKEAGPMEIREDGMLIFLHVPTWWDRFKARISYYALRAFGNFFTKRKK